MDSPIGTLFPGDDGSPGEHPDAVGTNLDDTPILPSADNWGESKIAPSTGQVRPMEDESAAVEGAEPPPAEKPRQARTSRLQERLGRLTRARREAESQVGQYSAQLAAVLQANQELVSQLAQMRAAPAAVSPAAGQGGDPFASSGSNAIPITAADVQRIVGDAVSRAIAPVVQSQRGAQEIASTRMAHEQSFADARSEYPDLADSNSELRRTFNELFDGADEDFRRRPDAPYRIALEARALLADERRNEQRQASRKRAAGVHVPTPTASDELEPAGVNSRSVQAGVDAAKQRLRTGLGTFEDFKLIRLAGAKQTR